MFFIFLKKYSVESLVRIQYYYYFFFAVKKIYLRRPWFQRGALNNTREPQDFLEFVNESEWFSDINTAVDKSRNREHSGISRNIPEQPGTWIETIKIQKIHI